MPLRSLSDDRYIPPIVDPENPEIKNSDNTVLFLMSCYQYIMIALILSVGPPYREPMVQNCTIVQSRRSLLVPFMVTIIIAVLFTTVMILVPPSFMSSILELTYTSTPFAFLMIAIGVANFALGWLAEKVIFVQIRAFWDRLETWRKKLSKRKQWTKKTKKYLMVEESM
jgi:cation-transporting P-type ATPase 13A2